MHKHIRKLRWNRRQLPRGLDVATQHDRRSRELRVRLFQNKMFSSRCDLSRLLVSYDQIDRVVAGRELQILSIENVVVENLVVIVGGKIHVEVTTQPRKH